jgi:apolipoprotein N-acyltransferase
MSIAVDPYGRMIGTVDHFEADERALVAQLPTQGVTTIYSIIGDVVPWLCVAGTVPLIVWAAIRRRRAPAAAR